MAEYQEVVISTTTTKSGHKERDYVGSKSLSEPRILRGFSAEVTESVGDLG